MSFNFLQFPGVNLAIGSDGEVPASTIPFDPDECCTDILCRTELEHACSYLDLLPTGPMWDVMKMKVRQQLVDNDGVPADGFDCPSLVTYAVYASQVLHHAVTETLTVAIRESRPETAVTTREDWLERLDWVDCYRSTCLASCLSERAYEDNPYIEDGMCGPCVGTFSDRFESALQHAILMVLGRLKVAGVKTVDTLNWIIEPLSVTLLVGEHSQLIQDYIDDPSTHVDCGPPCFKDQLNFRLCRTSPTIPAAPTERSFCDSSLIDPPVETLQNYTCDDVDVNLHPNVYVAKCILKATMPYLFTQEECFFTMDANTENCFEPEPLGVELPVQDDEPDEPPIEG